ncbi:MAG: ABC transporter ATP-binding protein [Oceanibaculum nanhaiense]|uniref:ABC transporter ATP-binding protein n=1 Tax=Oceanibaculum nanhaiense TaxID=1909734 RepID=UPI0025A47AEA|nr:ABC transporter ATP-binding protein [Oceanibaculum nanhaiense]MDM7946038.1 ABC transporter ATP-binding protein [Oceanibaculum nanhaiense]
MSTLDFVGPNGGAAAVRGMTPAAVAARPAETTRGGDPLVRIAGLTVAFDDGKRHVPVLHGIDLEVRPGETIGIVGESGCGKSVTWLAVLRLLGKKARIGGTVSLDGAPIIDFSDRSMARIRGKRIAMIFQDPASSLNPVHRIGQQLTEALALHRGLTGQAAKAEAIRLLDRVHIPNPGQRLNAYPHELSGGMNQRVMIAMALAGEPDLLVADEPTTALDATIQAQILDLLREIRQDSGMAMALISHDLGVIADICERVMVMYAGRVVETAPTNQLFANPGHPYTRGLLAALPDLGAPQRRLEAIPGTVPEPGKLPTGCSFRPRCVHAEEACGAEVPGLGFIEKTHQVACLKVDSL